MPLLAFWPLRCNRACDHECMTQGSTTRDSLLAPKLDGWPVLGWVNFRVILRRNSNSLGQQGIDASFTPKMRSCFCRVSL